MVLPQRFNLVEQSRDWLNACAEEYHYMQQAVHQKASPFGWALSFDGDIFRPNNQPNGFIIFASVHFTKLTGEFGYPGLPTKWQVLLLSRLWIHPDFQHGGQYYLPDILPGFVDRKGVFRSTLATSIIKTALGKVQQRWLEVHPPRYLDEPYHVRKIISYADTRFHEGTIYRAAKFREYGTTVSKKRHKNSRGPGIGDAELIVFIYDLAEPKWQYKPLQLSLFNRSSLRRMPNKAMQANY